MDLNSDGNGVYRRSDSITTLTINNKDVFTAEYEYKYCNKVIDIQIDIYIDRQIDRQIVRKIDSKKDRQ